LRFWKNALVFSPPSIHGLFTKALRATAQLGPVESTRRPDAVAAVNAVSWSSLRFLQA
jgi:hypothetical protein